jgi:aminoglycoside phosphotransferase family enzyme/predicted kinase
MLTRPVEQTALTKHMGYMETAETHTATLFFLGDRVYKLKKPVDLGFIDFRTREARLAACEAEVTLNRRLAPDAYVGVADIRDGDGVLRDHMVVMRRLPENRRLTTMLENSERLDDHLRALARLLAAFHERCETSADIAKAGSLATLEALWLEGIDGVAPYRGTVLDKDVIDEIGRLALRYLTGRGPLLVERQNAGRVRDGHGDLLAEDIYCLDDGPRVLDCVEFDQRLRVGDVLGDVAFLAMDLERLGAPDDAGRFLAWYREFSGENHPPSLEHLYIAYRAFVRTKIECVLHNQGDPHATERARRLAMMALDHLRRGRVRLVLVGGLPGTARSELAARLAEDGDGSVLLRFDEVRREAAGLAEDAPTSVPDREPEATYAELLRRAARALEHGESVVIDASWSAAGHRAAAGRLAEATAADLVELNCVGSPDAIAAGIASGLGATGGTAGRDAAGGDGSDATVEVSETAIAEVRETSATHTDPWPTATVVHTAAPAAEALTEACHHLA